MSERRWGLPSTRWRRLLPLPRGSAWKRAPLHRKVTEGMLWRHQLICFRQARRDPLLKLSSLLFCRVGCRVARRRLSASTRGGGGAISLTPTGLPLLLRQWQRDLFFFTEAALKKLLLRFRGPGPKWNSARDPPALTSPFSRVLSVPFLRLFLWERLNYSEPFRRNDFPPFLVAFTRAKLHGDSHSNSYRSFGAPL